MIICNLCNGEKIFITDGSKTVGICPRCKGVGHIYNELKNELKPSVEKKEKQKLLYG